MKKHKIEKWFDIVNVILDKKFMPDDEDIQKHTNKFMISTLLSCDPQFVEIAHEMSKVTITNKMYFDCLYHGIPKCKKFIKWNATKTKKEQDIQNIMEYFGCSQLTAKQYVYLIDPTELQYINDIQEMKGKTT